MSYQISPYRASPSCPECAIALGGPPGVASAQSGDAGEYAAPCIYAGAYRWGHRKIDPRKQKPGRPGTGRTVNTPEECEVLIPDRHPAILAGSGLRQFNGVWRRIVRRPRR